MDSMINVHREGILNVCDWANAWYYVRESFLQVLKFCVSSPTPRANEPRRASTLAPSQSNITNVNLILKFFIINTYISPYLVAFLYSAIIPSTPPDCNRTTPHHEFEASQLT